MSEMELRKGKAKISKLKGQHSRVEKKKKKKIGKPGSLIVKR
jgi:hypothetical protein